MLAEKKQLRSCISRWRRPCVIQDEKTGRQKGSSVGGQIRMYFPGFGGGKKIKHEGAKSGAKGEKVSPIEKGFWSRRQIEQLRGEA